MGIPDDPVAVYAEYFFCRMAVTVKMGRQRNAKMRSQKTCLFVRNYKICDVQILVNMLLLRLVFNARTALKMPLKEVVLLYLPIS